MANRCREVWVKARLWPAVMAAGLYPLTRHLAAKALPTVVEGFVAANARVEAVGDWKARRLAVADSMLGTDIVAVVIGGSWNCEALEPAQGLRRRLRRRTRRIECQSIKVSMSSPGTVERRFRGKD